MTCRNTSESRPCSGKSTAVLILSDGSVLWGQGLGVAGSSVGEICFNTSMTGYQEIITDPSYAGQIINFTFPHIGIVGANNEDIESINASTRGVILKAPITSHSNFRAAEGLDTWLRNNNLIGISGIDTRGMTKFIRNSGPPTGVLCHRPDGQFDIEALKNKAKEWPGLEGMDLAQDVSCREPYEWDQTHWQSLDQGSRMGFGKLENRAFHVVAVDFGIKLNILRSLASVGCLVTVVPAASSANDILSYKPDGVFLSNGPGDPAATGKYAVPAIRSIVASGLPLFGICLGHQILSLALGARTSKMHLGHRGANHPVKNLETNKVEITSQNHGFVVNRDTLPSGVTASHISLFDNSLEGLKVEGKPVFSVQYHPEASPGPQDSSYLFEKFTGLMGAVK